MELVCYLYDIQSCGYYETSGNKQYASTYDILLNLKKWVKSDNKNILDTVTYDINEGNEADVEQTLVYDISELDKTFLLTTWNVSTLVSDDILMAKQDDKPGNVQVVPQTVEDGYVPGYPCYFWFIPEEEIIAIILVDGQRKRGIDNLSCYMYNFLKYCSEYVIHEEHSDEVVIKGYGKVGDYRSDLFPRFKEKIKRLGGDIDYIKENYMNVRKIIQKNTISYNHAPSMWSNFLSKIGLVNYDNSDDAFEYTFEMNYNELTEDELDNIIDTWRAVPSSSKANDMGFKLKGQSNKIFWLSNSLAKSELSVSIAKEYGVVPADSLLYALNEYKSMIVISNDN